MTNSINTPTWARRWTFIMAATGSAVGLGNIWKFPYITGEYGGGAFVLVYLGCIVLIGLPIMMAEVLLGRAGRTDPVHSMLDNAKQSNASANWSIIGYVGILSGVLIMMFYSVVAGWIMDYLYQSATGSYANASPETIKDNFGKLVSNNNREIFWHSLFTLITAIVVGKGVINGIGKVVEILMPLLFALMLLLLAYSYFEGDFSSGVSFMFNTDFSKLSSEAVMEALGHAFFTLSLGMGSIMAYGAYMPGRTSIAKTVLAIGVLDTLVALIAGLIIFPLVFANDMQSSQSVGLLFKTLPITFSLMPGGTIFSVVFFSLVTIAALSSSISLIEPGVAWLERKGIGRKQATASLAFIAWLGGTACIYNQAVFDFLDNLTTQITLPLGGLLIAIFVGWVMNKGVTKQDIQLRSPALYQSWLWTVRVISPLGLIAIFAHKLGWI